MKNLPGRTLRQIESALASGRAVQTRAAGFGIPNPAAFTAEPESAFHSEVVALARLTGWRAGHFRKVLVKNGRRSYWATPTDGPDGNGWPDVVLARSGAVLFRELKTDGGTLSPDQTEWGQLLLSAGLDWKVWRPGDRDLIVAELTGG